MGDSKERIKAVVDLNYIVSSYMNEKGDYTDKDRERLLQLVIEGYRHLNLFHNTVIDVRYLTMDANGVIDLANIPDYVQYTKIGIPVGGKTWILGINEDILPRRDTMSAEATAGIFNNIETTVDYGYYFAGHYRNSRYTDSLYGLGGGLSRSYYRIDKETNTIQFDTSVPNSEIIIEYISTGVNKSGATLVPPQAIEPLKTYLNWASIRFDRKIPRTEKAYAEELWGRALAEFDAFENTPTVEEYLQYKYASIKQTPKR
jgi:hypothetical protein